MSKPPEERKQEIMDAAAVLFARRGYTATTIHDILEHVGIARGTFYYHFVSKEALLDALIEQQLTRTIDAARALVARDDLSAVEKLVTFWAGQQRSAAAEGLTAHIEEALDETAHLRLLSRLVVSLTPELTPIVLEGIAEGTFSTPHPTEATELILAGSSYLFDSGMIRRPDADPRTSALAFIHHVERILGAEPGTLAGFAALVRGGD